MSIVDKRAARGGPREHKSTHEEKHRCFCGVSLVAASCPSWYCAESDTSRLFCLTGGLSWGIRHDSWGRPLPAFSYFSRLQNRPVSTPNVLTLRDVRSHTRTHTHTRLSKILFFSLFHNIAGRKISNRIMENNNYLIFVRFLKLIFLRVFDTYVLWEEIWEIYYSFVIEFFFLFRSSYQPSFNDCVTGSNISNTEICVTIVCSLAQFLSEIHCERVNFIQWNMLQRNN